MSGAGPGPKRDGVAEFRPIARAAEALDKAIERQVELNPDAGFDDDRKVIGDAIRAVSIGFSDADRALVATYALAMRVSRERARVSTNSLRGRMLDAAAEGDEGEDEGPIEDESGSSGGVGGMGGPSVGKGKAPVSVGKSIHGRAVDPKGDRG